MINQLHIWELTEVFDDIILGRGVKRTIHGLEYEDHVYTDLFLERLLLYRFFPMAMKDIQVGVGKRFPAFYLLNKDAIFGHVFWEVFSDSRKRKIFGSVVRNKKGDWKFILPGSSSQIVYVNTHLPEDIDIYYLS